MSPERLTLTYKELPKRCREIDLRDLQQKKSVDWKKEGITKRVVIILQNQDLLEEQLTVHPGTHIFIYSPKNAITIVSTTIIGASKIRVFGGCGASILWDDAKIDIHIKRSLWTASLHHTHGKVLIQGGVGGASVWWVDSVRVRNTEGEITIYHANTVHVANTPEGVTVHDAKDVTIQNIEYVEVDDSVVVVAENIGDLFVWNVSTLSMRNVKKVIIDQKEST